MSLRKAILSLAAAALVVFAFRWVFGSDSPYAIAVTWPIAGLIIAVPLVLLLPKLGLRGSLFQRVEVVSAIVTGAAIFIAGGMYFFERRNTAQLGGEIQVSAVRAEARTGPVDHILLAIRVPIENRGQRLVQIKCTSIDIQAPVPGVALQRSANTSEEMRLRRVPGAIFFDSPEARECLAAEMRRRNASLAAIRPMFMWRTMLLEPNERDDRYFEIPVSCEFPFVRVLWKMRINPDDSLVNESKAIVSIWDVCRGETGAAPVSASIEP